MGRVSNGAPAPGGVWPPLRCSWDDWAIVIDGDNPESCCDNSNAGHAVRCLDLASGEEENQLRRLGLDWGGWLWRVNRAMDWVDEDGNLHRLEFAPDARLRPISGGHVAEQAEEVAA